VTERGIVVWFTGLPASGKTTLAREVRVALPAARSCVLLDSDELRAALGADRYAAGDRDAFYATVGRLASLLAAQGHVVLVAATAPRRAHRATVDPAIRRLEVHVDTPLATCEARDPKGLYARARAGEIQGMTGIDDPYEAPEAAELVVHPDDADPVGAILELLRTRGILA
jgi:bifunctional enzyme CysN/CysC